MKRSICKRILTAGLFAAGVLATSSGMAAVNMFMKVGTIQGDSVDSQHAGEMDVLAWSWGTSTGTATTKKGLLPPTCIQDLAFTKYIDRASPQLILNGVSGAVVPTARLTVRKAGQIPLEFLRLEMTNVSVVAYQTGGSGGEDRLTENVVLHFTSMQGVYVTQNPDGSAGAQIPFNVTGSCLR